MLAALNGLFATGGTVDCEPIARFGTTTQITVHVPPGVDSVRIDSALIEPMGPDTIMPQPIVAATGGHDAMLRFTPIDPTRQGLVRRRGKPSQIGPIPVAVTIGDGTVRRWKGDVLPSASSCARRSPVGSSITAVPGEDQSMVAARPARSRRSA